MHFLVIVPEMGETVLVLHPTVDIPQGETQTDLCHPAPVAQEREIPAPELHVHAPRRFLWRILGDLPVLELFLDPQQLHRGVLQHRQSLQWTKLIMKRVRGMSMETMCQMVRMINR